MTPSYIRHHKWYLHNLDSVTAHANRKESKLISHINETIAWTLSGITLHIVMCGMFNITDI